MLGAPGTGRWGIAAVAASLALAPPTAVRAQAGAAPTPEPPPQPPSAGATGAASIDASTSAVRVEAGVAGPVPWTVAIEELPAPTEGPPITLERAFDLARARHPALRGVRIELEKADAMLRQAWGALLPQVSGQLMYTLNDQATVVDISGGISIPGIEMPGEIVVRQQHIVQAQVRIAAPLFNMPILSAIETAEIAADMALLGKKEAERELLLGVATAYYGCLAARELVDLQLEAFAAARERLRAARVRLDAGAGIRIDVARAELELETARMNHQAALLAYDSAREALAGLLLMDDLPIPEAPAEEEAIPSGPDELVIEAMDARADLVLARRKIDLAEQQLRSAWTEFFPSVAVAWQLQSELTEPPGFGGRHNAWALVFLLDVPIYSQSRYGLLDQRRAEIRQAEIALETAEMELRTTIRTAVREYESTLTTIETAERQVALAEEALALAEAGRAAGAGTSLDVTDAQERVNQAMINVTVQRYKARLALVKLLFMIGRLP